MMRSRRLVACAGCALAVAACATGAPRTPAAAWDPAGAGGRADVSTAGVERVDSSTIAGEIGSLLRASAEAWNRGDLEAFLEGYSDDPALAFVGSSGVVRGKDAVRERYRASYFSGEGEPDDLAFDELTVRPLTPDLAVAHGRWTLFQPGFDVQTVTAQGRFTLVFRLEEDGRWRIVHDHSS